MLCQFLLYNKVNQLHVCIYPLPLELLPATVSLSGYPRPSWAPCCTAAQKIHQLCVFHVKLLELQACRQLTLLMRENSGLCWLGGLGYGYLALFTFFSLLFSLLQYSQLQLIFLQMVLDMLFVRYVIMFFVLLNMTCYNNSLV